MYDDRQHIELFQSPCEYLFRGALPSSSFATPYQGIGVTPTSVDPIVATLFACRYRMSGPAVVLIALKSDYTELLDGPNLSSFQYELAVNIEIMEFHISGSVRGESGSLAIIGRCGDEPVRPGTEFRAIFRTKPRAYPAGLESPPEVEECRDLHITVQEVETCGKSVEVLPPNMTGILRCADSSVELVPGGWVLTDQCVSAKAETVHCESK